MLNVDLLDTLYNSLTPDKQKILLERLFKRSRQTMAYFRRTKDISMSKLEILADFYHMPLDYFRENSSFKANNVVGTHNNVGNFNVNTNLLTENEMLRGQLKQLDKTVAAKEETIASKNEVITSKNMEIEAYKSQIRFLTEELSKYRS